MTDHVQILLATHEGARYLEEQLESLLAQTFTRWKLVARDDGSTDDTPSILQRYAGRHPDRIRLLAFDGRRLGAMGNFGALLESSGGSHVMFCDQDDVWLPDKIEVTRSAMAELEIRHGTETPLLVHTDLRVVDERLGPISDSMWRFQHIDPSRLSVLPRALLQNFVTGCTAMVNRALLDLALPIPPDARMHDWWLTLVALSFGAVRSLPTATILYRQHGKNERGASGFSPLRAALELLDRDRWRQRSEARWTEVRRLEAQAEAFLDRFRDRLPQGARDALAAFSVLSRQGGLARRASIVRHGFYYSNPVTTAAMLLFR
jgi:glycosyltransferase involved in cell wall biosynthesis